MTTSPNNGDDHRLPPSSSTVILMLTTLGDTAWRLFVPSVGLTVVGLLLDKKFHTSPWLLAIGVVMGAVIAVWLVRLQIKKEITL